MRRRLGRWAAGVAWCALATGVRANDASEARFLDELARGAYERRDYDAALEAFLLVHRAAPSESALYNSAVCAELAGREALAYAQYREYLLGDDSNSGRRADVEARLAALSARLSLLEVTSDPPGATIYVDRTELAAYGVTPRTIAVDAGEHVLIVESERYERAAIPFVAQAGTPSAVRVALRPRLGEIALEMSPASATARFRDARGEVEHRRVRGRYRLQVGSYVLTATAPGYAPAEARVVISERGVARVTLALRPRPKPTGRLLVATGGVAADVFVDGRRVAVAPATVPGLAVGEHEILVRAHGVERRRRVRIEPDRSVYVEISLAERAP